MAPGLWKAETSKLKKSFKRWDYLYRHETADADDHVVCLEISPHEFGEVGRFVVCSGRQLISD